MAGNMVLRHRNVGMQCCPWYCCGPYRKNNRQLRRLVKRRERQAVAREIRET